jgi:hypothetical protein
MERPKLEAAKLLAAKLEASCDALVAKQSDGTGSFRRSVGSLKPLVGGFKPVVGSFKLSGQKLGGFQLWQ